jgi:hypothetical protein
MDKIDIAARKVMLLKLDSGVERGLVKGLSGKRTIRNAEFATKQNNQYRVSVPVSHSLFM